MLGCKTHQLIQVRLRCARLMELAAKLAGFLAAHAVWCVAEKETLIPLMGFETAEGKRQMHRFMADRIEQGVREGQDRLASNSEGATRAALIYDGFITLPTGKVDALLVDIRDHGSPSPHCSWPCHIARRVARRDLQSIARSSCRSLGQSQIIRPLVLRSFEGVDSHDKAAPVWSRHLDESL